MLCWPVAMPALWESPLGGCQPPSARVLTQWHKDGTGRGLAQAQAKVQVSKLMRTDAMPQKPLSHQKSLANNTPSFSHHHHLAPLTLPATSALPSSQHILQAWCTSAHTHPRSLSLKLVSTGMQAQARTPVRDKRPLPSSPSLITSPRHPCKSITSHGQPHPPQPLSSLPNTKRLING